MSWHEFEKRIRALNDHQGSEHFNIYFNHHNPRRQIGMITGGVRSRALISFYVDALERLYRTMSGPLFNRQKPTGNGKKTNVYVLDLSGLTASGEPFTASSGGDAYIALPCRTDEPTIHAEYQYAATSAVHEATHVFNHAMRPIGSSRNWQWFDEATAIFMESWVLPGNQDYLRLSRNWNDTPEASLDDEQHWYAAGSFAAYLVKSEGSDFLTTIWNHTRNESSALEAIEESLKTKSKRLFSDNPKELNTVFSQYCIDSYMLWDTSGLGFLPDLYARYGERAVTESFPISGKNRWEPSAYSLNHLACRYFLLDVREGVRQLEVRMKTSLRDGKTFLKATLMEIRKNLSRGETWPLRPNLISEADTTALFSTGSIPVDPSVLDHMVLVISHCGYRDSHVTKNLPVNNIHFLLEINS